MVIRDDSCFYNEKVITFIKKKVVDIQYNYKIIFNNFGAILYSPEIFFLILLKFSQKQKNHAHIYLTFIFENWNRVN